MSDNYDKHIRLSDSEYSAMMSRLEGMDKAALLSEIDSVLHALTTIRLECDIRGLEKMMGHRSPRSVQSRRFINLMRATQQKLEQRISCYDISKGSYKLQ